MIAIGGLSWASPRSEERREVSLAGSGGGVGQLTCSTEVAERGRRGLGLPAMGMVFEGRTMYTMRAVRERVRERERVRAFHDFIAHAEVIFEKLKK